MGEEADADWQDGLVEWGQEDAQPWLDDKMMEALMGGRRQKPRQTALRARGKGFETVEIDDDGKIIEPVRCICGGAAILHRPKCPLYGLSV